MAFVDVALSLPKNPFTYAIEEMDEPPQRGMRVKVPFINSTKIGIITDIHETCSLENVKPVEKLVDEEPILSSELLELTKWMSEYYSTSWGEALSSAVPGLIRRGRRISYKKDRHPFQLLKPFHHTLNPAQEEAYRGLKTSLSHSESASALLHGVTGSGKSEIYMRLLQEVLERGESAIVMVPEIALSHQLMEFFRSFFDGTLEVFHSRLTEKERFEAWARVRSGQRRLVLGPRSALFAPLENIGLIVMDEEQESSYKQEDVPRYHAREVAEKLASLHGALFVMGSATPSLEARMRAETGVYSYYRLAKRVSEKPMPEVKVIDLKNEMTKGGNLMLSRPLQMAIRQTLEKQGSIVLFLNRRGFATTIQCTDCGWILMCKHCEIAMTYHASDSRVSCHYCGFNRTVDKHCGSCGETNIKYGGGGTEKVEAVVKTYFKEARVERLDTDRVKKRGDAEEILNRFRAKKIDILIGTQMLAKGFDFPNVTLVGVINADSMLSMPDFRSHERAFQLITQVAGRAGRGEKPGEVYIQSFSPENYAIGFARHHDYESFYQKEIQYRRELQYPPFSSLASIVFRSRDETYIEKKMTRLAEDLLKEEDTQSVSIMGPAKLPFYKLRNYFRWGLLIKGPELVTVREKGQEIVALMRSNRKMYSMLDIEPMSIL